MKAKASWVDGLTFVSSGDSGHYVIMDSKFEGREQKANGPMELLLQSLCACTGMDVVSILRKMHEPLTGFEITLDATRANEHPKVFTSVNLEYIVYGDVNPESLEKAIKLSQEKYCTISVMLKRAGVAVAVSRKIINNIK